MKKLLKVFSVVLCMVLVVSLASAANDGTEEEELNATATFVMNTIVGEKTSADDFTAGYNDVYRVLLCLKSGVSNDDVVATIDASVESQLKDYNAGTFLGASTKEDMSALCLSVAILYLQERGVDVTDCQGNNLLEMLDKCYMNKEIDFNPYTYQVIAGVVRNYPDYDWADVKEKLSDDVLSCYVEGNEGVGMEYWGVSADNNGMIFPALLAVGIEDYKDKIEKANDWMMTQTNQDGAVIYYGNPSVDSTALALKFAATFGYDDEAEMFFKALNQFEDAEIDGAYESWGSFDISTTDVLYGLLQYNASKDGKYFLDLVNVPEEPTPEVTPVATPDDAAPDETPETGDAGLMMVGLVMFAALAGYVGLKRA